MNAAARGLAAGFAGTIALTGSQRIEMALTGRAPSDLPARVAEGLLGISPRGRARDFVAFATHWVNNTSGGIGRALLGRLGLRGPAAAAGTLVLYVGAGTLLFLQLGLAPPPWRRKPRGAVIELIHASVYALACNAAYERLEPPLVA